MQRRPIVASLAVACLLSARSSSAVAADWAAALQERIGVEVEVFAAGERPAFVLTPPQEKRSVPQPWIMYAPALPDYPDQHEAWMHQQFVAAGIAVAGVDAGEAYGSPRGRAAMTALYEELTTKRDFARKACLLGRSRGGLWVASWAAENVDKVAGIAGIYPVFDLRSYPGLDKAAPAYELTAAELAANLSAHNPIEKIAVLADARIPAWFIHGDVDEVVTLEANSSAFAARYLVAGVADLMHLQVVKGQGHNFWPGFFQSQELVDFVIAQAKVGVKP